MNDEFFFVNETLQFRTGAEAEALVTRMNDQAYVDEIRGVVKVPKERWRIAQAYERNTWMVAGVDAEDDRNRFHEREFDCYNSIRGKRFKSAVECGCGPFTNLRIIGRHCRIVGCTLLDPLINEYVVHKNCTYSTGILQTGETALSRWLGKGRAGRALKPTIAGVSPRLLMYGIPVELVISKPLEDVGDVGHFDLIVMINVIEHCYDIDMVFGSILSFCKHDSLLIFHDRLYNASRLKRRLSHQFDAGHPLRVDGEIIMEFLHSNFSTIFERTVDIKDGYASIDLTERGVYFIGQRR
jgi:SAM-dependent methyltransferase